MMYARPGDTVTLVLAGAPTGLADDLVVSLVNEPEGDEALVTVAGEAGIAESSVVDGRYTVGLLLPDDFSSGVFTVYWSGDGLDDPVADDELLTVGTAATAQDVLALLSSTPATVISPIATDGSIVLVRGDDYAAADGRALRFSSPAWPTLTGSAIKFRTKRRGAGATVLEVSASLTAPAIVDVALTASQTDLKPGTYTYEVEATLSGRKITLALGKLVVKGDVR